MGEVLSQEEIDNLLQALSTGEIDAEQIQDSDEKQVKDYDFKRPAKFSKEHLRTLEIIFEHYGRLLSTNLPVYLRKNVQVSVNSSETVTFSEFTNALSNPVILSILNFSPLTGSIIMELSPNLGFAIIDRMLGGQGEPLERTRDFSEIEMTILEKILVICMQLLREPWKNVIEISPILERIETNPQFAQIISPSDMIAIVTLNIKIGEVAGLMNICLPYFTLENIMDTLMRMASLTCKLTLPISAMNFTLTTNCGIACRLLRTRGERNPSIRKIIPTNIKKCLTYIAKRATIIISK